MDVTTPRRVGESALSVTPLGFGAAPIAGPAVPDDVALATVREAWDQGVRFFDTAPWYGIGRSERRLGLALGALDARGPIRPQHQGRQVARARARPR